MKCHLCGTESATLDDAGRCVNCQMALELQADGVTLSPPVPCNVCHEEPAMPGHDSRMCRDCYFAGVYLCDHLGFAGMKGVADRLQNMQDYLHSQLGYTLKASAIAVVLVLEEKGRVG